MPRFLTIKKTVEELLPKVAPYYQLYPDKALPDPAYDRLIITLMDLFEADYRNMAMSCDNVKGVVFTEDVAYELLWRLVANKETLNENRPVLYYDKHTLPGVEEVMFISIAPKGPDYRTKIRVLTGYYAFNIIKRDFTDRGMENVLRTCGYHGRKYLPGNPEECLPGLCAVAELLDYRQDSRILKRLFSDKDMEAFNRKYVIGPRSGKSICPVFPDESVQCDQCNVCRRKCFASYKEKEND